MTDETTTPAPSAPAKAAPRIIGDKHFRAVPLEWPIEHDGRVIDKITVRRMTGAEVSAFIATLRDNPEAARLSMYDVPHEVIDALDADDYAAIQKAVNDFLPRALREES
jgi:hypothetical protein